MPVWLTGTAIKVLAALALIAAILFSVNRYNEQQRNAGREECKAAVASATVKAVEAALVKEREGVAAQAMIQAKLNKDTKDELAKKDGVIAKLRNGTLVLRDPGNTSSGKGTTTPGSVAGSNATTGSELSGSTSEFLVSEATRANQVVFQLQACQAELVNDRKIVNGGIH